MLSNNVSRPTWVKQCLRLQPPLPPLETSGVEVHGQQHQVVEVRVQVAQMLIALQAKDASPCEGQEFISFFRSRPEINNLYQFVATSNLAS